MPSLYHHEQLSGQYTVLPDETLVAYSVELQQMREETYIPRQIEVINRLLGYLAFEISQRIEE